MIINDLIPGVVDKLRGRTDKISSIPYYIAQALVDLSQNYEFEELKVTGPLTNFVQNLSEYPLRGYDPLGISGNPFIQASTDRITFIREWFMYFDTSGVVTPGVSTGTELKDRDVRVVRSMSVILGLPSVYCLVGSYDNYGYILVGSMPDNPYPCQMVYQRQHPFNVTWETILQSVAVGNTSIANQVATSKVWMPIDWTEIITLAAAEKACLAIGMNDIAMSYHQQIYGYKDKKGNEMPGIITVRMTQQDRQTSFNERALRPIVRRYT